MAHETWGRWGREDEHGALNWIGAQEIRAAAGLVRQGRVLSLAQPLGPKTPVPAHRLGVGHFMDRDGGDYAAGGKRPGGFQFAEDTIILPAHSGTHVDALAHVWYDNELYNGFAGDTIRSTTGAQRCGADKLLPIVTRGVLLDVAGASSVLSPGETIPRDRLQAIADRAGITLQPGDVVLIRTGWVETYMHDATRYYDPEPGIDVSAAIWLAEAGVAAVGADNYAVEVLPFPEGTIFPVHQRLIRDYGIPLFEGLVLAALAATEVTTFLFVAAPLPLVGGTASPVTPLAVL
jgi:kynurenine formamidase